MKSTKTNNIFAQNLDEKVIKQFQDCLQQNFCIKGALMPDAHYGYVAPIGSVLITKGVIVPSWVGYDIGCGVIAIKIKGKNLLPKVKKYSKDIFDEISKKIPMGLGKMRAEHTLYKETKEKLEEILKKLKKTNPNKEIFNYLKRKAKSNLGTLGHGNHFIELAHSSEAKLYI
jgi:tRNA-splicing ligase RtcB (3'-phosphate/5'-hydroxy nucleic acid ligase)